MRRNRSTFPIAIIDGKVQIVEQPEKHYIFVYRYSPESNWIAYPDIFTNPAHAMDLAGQPKYRKLNKRIIEVALPPAIV